MPKPDIIENNALSAVRKMYASTYGEVSELRIECRAADYSASAISRAVEDCNAHLLWLCVLPSDGGDTELPSSQVYVDLCVNHRNPSTVARSLERYGYAVVYANGVGGDGIAKVNDEPEDTTLRNRANEILHYLEMK